MQATSRWSGSTPASRTKSCTARGINGGIYTLSTRPAKATKSSPDQCALAGKRFGVDFNPAANRLRVISDTGQNLRHNVNDPLACLPLQDYGGRHADLPACDRARDRCHGAEYTNNDLDPSAATTLFDLDT